MMDIGCNLLNDIREKEKEMHICIQKQWTVSLYSAIHIVIFNLSILANTPCDRQGRKEETTHNNAQEMLPQYL